ncbi:MAG TPA: GNAT family N-acetyltransferase [Chloroflexia bacterium]|jgi:predicted acetyltransferase|nr:GNAT family N-acetyltransferase [Chloroflexia bacterium]
MDADPVTLIEPTPALAAAFQAMVEEFRQAGEASYQRYRDLIRDDFPGYVRWTESLREANPARPDRVPESIFWLVRAGHTVLGSSRLRYGLTAQTAQTGGHIGYDIRPGARRQGYGTRLLALTLDRARAAGFDRVLITCDTANLGSARVIEKNGGVLENRLIDPASGEEVSRYWITL